MPVRVFICYARKDAKHRERLESHLAFMKRADLVTTWSDGQLSPGERWEPSLLEELERAHVLVALITANFAESLYCQQVELERAHHRHLNGTLQVIPILVEETGTLADHWLGRLQRLPEGRYVAVQSLKRKEPAWAAVANRLRETILRMPDAKARPVKRTQQFAVVDRRTDTPPSPKFVDRTWTECEGARTPGGAWRVTLRSPFRLRVIRRPMAWSREDQRIPAWHRVAELAKRTIAPPPLSAVRAGDWLLTLEDPITAEPRGVLSAIGGRILSLAADGEEVDGDRPIVEIEMNLNDEGGDHQFVEDRVGTQIAGVVRFQPSLEHPGWPHDVVQPGYREPIRRAAPNWRGEAVTDISVECSPSAEIGWLNHFFAPIPGVLESVPAEGTVMASRKTEFAIRFGYHTFRVNWNLAGDIGAAMSSPKGWVAAGSPIVRIAPREGTVECPMVGTFYRAKSPAAEPYVRPGAYVRRGEAICNVEAMKLFNEIEAPFDGWVTEILVDDRQPVQFGQPLMIIARRGA